VVAVARSRRLASLLWPAHLLAADLGVADQAEHRAAATDVLYGVLRHADPAGRLLAEASPWVPVVRPAGD
jgi:hypothetical protein